MKNGMWLVNTLLCALMAGCSELPAGGGSTPAAPDDGDLGVTSQALETEDFACLLSDLHNFGDYLQWWEEITLDSELAAQFWPCSLGKLGLINSRELSPPSAADHQTQPR